MAMEPKVSMEVARSLYAQMCLFYEETEEQKQHASITTKKTAYLVRGIGTLLLIFVVVTSFYITELAGQFVQIINSMDSMNKKVVIISKQMSIMRGEMAHMNDDIYYMNNVLFNMKDINPHIDGMAGEMEHITGNIIHFNKLGVRAMNTMKSMNRNMDVINESTRHMNYRIHQIAKPAKFFP